MRIKAGSTTWVSVWSSVTIVTAYAGVIDEHLLTGARGFHRRQRLDAIVPLCNLDPDGVLAKAAVMLRDAYGDVAGMPFDHRDVVVLVLLDRVWFAPGRLDARQAFEELATALGDRLEEVDLVTPAAEISTRPE